MPAANSIISFPPADFLQLGLSHFWDDGTTANTCHKTNVDRFKKRFGVNPEICSEIFRDLQVVGTQRKPNPKYLLMGLNHLKEYPIDSNLAGPFRVTEKTALLWAKRHVVNIALLKELKVRD